MKTDKKIFALLLLLLTAGLYLASVTTVFAAADASADVNAPTTLIVPIGGVSAVKGPGEYISTIFKWGIGFAALLALGQLVLGGVLYTLSAGSIANQEGAKERIKSSITGLILLVGSVTLLATINPRLVNLTPQDASKSVRENIERSRTEGAKLRANRSPNAAAQAAKLRMEGNPDKTSDCFKAAADIEALIDYFNSQRTSIYKAVERALGDAFAPSSIIADITNWPGAFGHLLHFYDGHDFKTHLEKMRDAPSGSYEYHCYQDSLIVAYDYARLNLPEQDFNDLKKALGDLPRDLGADILMADDPFEQANVPAQTLRNQLLLTLPAERQQAYADMKRLIDAGNLNGLIQKIESDVTAISTFITADGLDEYLMVESIALYYAKDIKANNGQFSSEKYAQLTSRLNSDAGSNQNLEKIYFIQFP